MHLCTTTDQVHQPTCQCWVWLPKPTCCLEMQSTMTNKVPTKHFPFSLAKLYLSSVMPGTCASLPPSSTKPIMAPIWSKSLVVDSTDVLMITFENIIQMLLNQTHPNWQCSTSCIYTSSYHPGSEIANSCCTHNTNTSSYTANSMQSSSCSMFTTRNTDAIHWSLSEPDWHSPCCLMLINSKQEATIQASWRDIDPDCPSDMNLMMPWPGMSLAPLTSHPWWCDRMYQHSSAIIKEAHTPTFALNIVLDFSACNFQNFSIFH